MSEIIYTTHNGTTTGNQSARHDLHTESDPTHRRVNRATQAGQRPATDANFKSFTRNF